MQRPAPQTSVPGGETHAAEVAAGRRFEFGKNWARFLELLNEERIAQAEASLLEFLEVPDLRGLSFLDIGSGSGLFSLAARRLGARVESFDFDPHSVACAMELRRRYFAVDDPAWRVQEGSALDEPFMRALGQFDVVYSWGVLHHTGRMWDALELAGRAVAPGGRLFIALYNDTGSQSDRWRTIKKAYNRLPGFLRPAFAVLVSLPGEARSLLGSVLRGRPGDYFSRWTAYDRRRGMDRWRDILDWVGGYPYEVAGPDEVFEFFKARGFSLAKMACSRVGLGCNQFVFQRVEPAGRAQ